jgi:hypothetical protein
MFECSHTGPTCILRRQEFGQVRWLEPRFSGTWTACRTEDRRVTNLAFLPQRELATASEHLASLAKGDYNYAGWSISSRRRAHEKEQKLSKEIVDHLVELGIRVRVLAIAVEGLGRARGRDQDGIAMSAMLVQLSDEIVDVTEMITPSSTLR